MALKEYKEKRNFKITKEPKGNKKQSEKNNSFIIQHHIASRDHFDFRLAYNGVLLSWAVPKGPSLNPKDKRLAIKVEDHPLEYAKFEGTIPQGSYGGGIVMLWDKGEYNPLNNFEEGLEKGILKFSLFGKRLKGNWTLIRIKNENNWLLIKEKDEYAKNNSSIKQFKTSITTNRTMEEIKQNSIMPLNDVSVTLATLKEKVPQDDNWLFEIKHDGYRAISYINDEVKIESRNNKDLTSKFKSIALALKQSFSDHSSIVDGEIVIFDEKGKSDFAALQNIKKETKASPTYVIFDLLYLDGKDLRNQPLIKRKEKLEKLLKNSSNELMFSKHVIGQGTQAFEFATLNDLEGIIGKRIDSIYKGARTDDWIKIKCHNRQEFIIGGYIKSNKQSRKIQSLLLGYYKDNKLIYAGKVGSGLNQKLEDELLKKLKLLKKSPFHLETFKKNQNIVFTSPTILVEVKFMNWSSHNHLRQPSILGLRLDKAPKQVQKEESEKIKITHPDKLVFKTPPLCKRDIVNYYATVAPYMFPYIKNRLLSTIRCPSGVDNSCF